jgi:hypothetical protein
MYSKPTQSTAGLIKIKLIIMDTDFSPKKSGLKASAEMKSRTMTTDKHSNCLLKKEMFTSSRR